MAALLDADRLIVGMQLPIQAQSSAFVEQWEAGAGPGDLHRIATTADRVGFGYLAVCDHVAVPVERVSEMGAEWWDTIATLGWLAGITDHTLLVSHVMVPALRHPLAVAKAFATLDVVSGGRVAMGVGAGHVESEMRTLGVDHAVRGSLLDEAIDALRACFTNEVPAHHGAAWDFEGLAQRPRPTRHGGPPIWVGGSSPAAVGRAATRGDGWLPQGPLGPDQAEALRSALRAAGRQGEDFDLGALAGPVHLGEPTWDVGRCLTGPPEKIAHVLAKLAGLGARQVQVRLRSRDAEEAVDQVEAFGATVLPLLADVRPAPLFA